ncbi:MAG: PP2C family protein-serine/threonine phosphatase [Acidobacteriota bacterium]
MGGDLVDFIRLESGRVALFLGDVVGKGLGAALLMAKLQSTLRTLIPEEGSLEDLGRRTNQIFCRDGLPGKFATAVYLEIGPDEGQVQVLNAGHLPPVVLHCGTHESLPPVAMPFGILSGESYHEQSLAVPPGGLLLAYSDGLTEAFNEAEECFGDERVEALFPALEGRSAEAAGQFILQAVDRFIGDRRPSDDLSLIVLRRWAGSESTSAS